MCILNLKVCENGVLYPRILLILILICMYMNTNDLTEEDEVIFYVYLYIA